MTQSYFHVFGVEESMVVEKKKVCEASRPDLLCEAGHRLLILRRMSVRSPPALWYSKI